MVKLTIFPWLFRAKIRVTSLFHLLELKQGVVICFYINTIYRDNSRTILVFYFSHAESPPCFPHGYAKKGMENGARLFLFIKIQYLV